MSDGRYTLDAFLEKTRDRDLNQGLFELDSDRMLDINLDGEVWIKLGAMVAYTGQVKFEREGILSRGIGNLLKKAVSGDGTSLTGKEDHDPAVAEQRDLRQWKRSAGL